MPFLKRSELLYDTLMSFILLYKDRDDFEIIIGEDIKNKDREHDKLLNVISYFSNRGLNIVHLKTKFENCYNPAPIFNACYEASKGEFLILTNPECLHSTNVLKGLDEEFNCKKADKKYIICACKNLGHDVAEGKLEWYQHSKYRNKGYHFCSAISRKLFSSVGGFDEEYAKGMDYDDDDFIASVRKSGADVIERDDLLVHHQYHKRIELNIPDHKIRKLRNRKYFVLKWRDSLGETFNPYLHLTF